MRPLAWVALVAACRFQPAGNAGSGDPDGSSGQADGPLDDALDLFDALADAQVDGAGVADAPIDAAPPCSVMWTGTVTLQNVRLLPNVNSTADDRDPWIDPTGPLLFQSSNRGGGLGDWDFWVSAIDSVGEFQAAENLGLSTAQGDYRIAVYPNDAVFASNRTAGTDADLFVAPRTAPTTFGAPVKTPFSMVNDAASQHDPFVVRGRLELFWAQDVEGRVQDLYHSVRASTDVPFPAGNALDELNSTDGDADAALSGDGLLIVFSSSRPASPGGSNVYYARRTSRAEVFGTPVLLDAPVNSSSDEADPFLTPDGCHLLFATNRGSGSDWDLFAADFPDP